MKTTWFHIPCLCRYVAWVVLLFSLASNCLAQTPYGPITSIPTVPNASTIVSGSVVTQVGGGLNVTVDSRWLDGSGYRPIRIKITPIAAVIADRELLVSLTIHQLWNPSDRNILIEQYITIPVGTQAGQAIMQTISMPPSPLWSDFSIEIIDPAAVTVSGTVFKQQQLKTLANRISMPGMEIVMTRYPRILFVDNVLPNASLLAACLSQQTGYQGFNPNITTAATAQPLGNQENLILPSAVAFPTGELPERWIDYSSLDVICISIDQLAGMAKNRPNVYHAILQWGNSGGNLWIYGLSGAKGPWDRLAELEKLLDMPASEGAKSRSNIDARGWNKPSDELFGQRVAITESNNNSPQPAYSTNGQPIYETPQPQAEVPAEKHPPAPAEPSFLTREYGMGMVAAITTPDPFSGEQQVVEVGMGLASCDYRNRPLAVEYPAWRGCGTTEYGFLELSDPRRRTGSGEDVSGSYHAIRPRHWAGQLLAAAALEKNAFDSADCSSQCRHRYSRAVRLCTVCRRTGHPGAGTQHYAIRSATRRGCHLGPTLVLRRIDAFQRSYVFAQRGRLSHHG